MKRSEWSVGGSLAVIALALSLGLAACGTQARGSVVAKDGSRHQITLDSGHRLVVDDLRVEMNGVSYGAVEAGQRVELFVGGAHDGEVRVDGEVREPVGDESDGP